MQPPAHPPAHPDTADCPFVIYSEEFLEVLGPEPRLELVVATDAHEGPVYVKGQDALYFTTVPQAVNVPSPGYKTVAISRLDLATARVAVVRQPSNMANGMTLDREGRLVVCEQGTRSSPAAISRLDLATGVRESLVEQWFGLPFNSPNDVVVKSDGSIWFTDPSYGIDSDYEGDAAESEIGSCNVYRLDPATGRVTLVASDFVQPNGLAFSPDEALLYIADTGLTHKENGPRHVRRFKVAADGAAIADGEVFATCPVGVYDGFRVDVRGDLWLSAGDGVHCHASDGALLGKVLIPEPVANVCFGGPKLNRLFICGTTSLYSVFLNTRAASRP